MNIKNIQVLLESETDLEEGRFFYESQEQGVGEYFWDSFLSDIESLIIYAGVHSKALLPNVFKEVPIFNILRFK
jgi:hypothetical protein